MNAITEILNYAEHHHVQIAAHGGKLKLKAPDGVLTPDFLERTKLHKQELLKALSKNDVRCDPELAIEGFHWCLDCRFLQQFCTHPDNPFRHQCTQTPRKCRWYEKNKTVY